MSYSSTVKRAHGAFLSIDGAADILDCTIVGIHGNGFDLIEKTSLGASRKEWDASDTPDSDEIVVTMPNTGQDSLASGTEVEIVITIPTILKTWTFDALVIKDNPQASEVGGLLMREITFKPLEAPDIRVYTPPT
jgi:hypothetical protein